MLTENGDGKFSSRSIRFQPQRTLKMLQLCLIYVITIKLDKLQTLTCSKQNNKDSSTFFKETRVTFDCPAS